MSPSELAALLDERFRLLTGGRRTAVKRHQTLRATVDWSYSLLDDIDRSVFDRLSMFAGSFDAAAAIAVASDDDLAEWDVRDALTRLVRRSMVNADRDDSGNTRYSLLETLKEYASEQLHQRSEVEDRRRRHAQHFASLAATLGRSCAHATSSWPVGRSCPTSTTCAPRSSGPRRRAIPTTRASASRSRLSSRRRRGRTPRAASVAGRSGWRRSRTPRRRATATPSWARGLRRRPPRRRLGQCPGVFALDALVDGVPPDSPTAQLAHTALASVSQFSGDFEGGVAWMDDGLGVVRGSRRRRLLRCDRSRGQGDGIDLRGARRGGA